MEEDVELKFGKGLLSGYLSAVLGIVSLCGVLCFRFPQLLTSEEFRAAYPVDFVRTTLFITLMIAYIMGIISYVLNQTKTLVWIGICSAFTASLLGGSRSKPTIQPPIRWACRRLSVPSRSGGSS